MNGPRKSFGRLVDLARRETPPALDVADRVLQTLDRSPRRAEPGDRSLWIMAAGSLAAAVAVMLLLGWQLGLENDPLAQWFSSLTWLEL